MHLPSHSHSNSTKDMPTDKSSETVKQARRQLAERVRVDWSFEPPLDSPEDARPAPVPLKDLLRNNVQPQLESEAARSDDWRLPYANEWQERTYASSDPSSCSEDEGDADTLVTTTLTSPRLPVPQNFNDGLFSHREILRKTAPVGTVDEVAPAQSNRRNHARNESEGKKLERKKRRRKRFEEEMQWNEGLRYWAARRDAWCGARRVYADDDGDMPNRVQVEGVEDSKVNGTSHTLSTERQNGTFSSTSPQTSANGPSSAAPEPSSDIAIKTFVPKLPPLLSSTTITQPASSAGNQPVQQTSPTLTITPAQYPSIYVKIVKQSLTPSLPINLAHIVPALVQGWKVDGEWPPKSTNPDDDNPQPTGPAGSLLLTVKGGAAALARRQAAREREQEEESKLPKHRRGNNAIAGGLGLGLVVGGAGTGAMMPGYQKRPRARPDRTDAPWSSSRFKKAAAAASSAAAAAVAVPPSHPDTPHEGASASAHSSPPAADDDPAAPAAGKRRARRRSLRNPLSRVASPSETQHLPAVADGDEGGLAGASTNTNTTTTTNVLSAAAQDREAEPDPDPDGDLDAAKSPTSPASPPVSPSRGDVRRSLAKMGKALRMSFVPPVVANGAATSASAGGFGGAAAAAGGGERG